MSERKSKRESVKKQPNMKPPSTKQKIIFPSKPENEITTVSKNLLREFNEVQSHHHHRQQRFLEQQKLKESGFSSQSLQQSSGYQSNESKFEKYELAVEPSKNVKQARTDITDFAQLQLPKSYVLAMRGLQEAVEQREKETSKAKRQIKEQNSLYENIFKEKEELSLAKTILETKINQFIMENKFYRQTINEMKAQAAQQSSIKIDLQKQLKAAQQAISHHLNVAESLKKDTEAEIRDKAVMKEQLQRVIKCLEQKKNDYNELLIKRSEQFAHNYSEIGSLRQQLSKLKQQHQKDISQVNLLREEVAILSQRLVFEQARFKEKVLIQEKIQLDKLEKELQANRNILQEVTFDQNRLRQSFHDHFPLPTQPKQPAPAPTPVKQLKQPEQSVNLERSARQERASTMRQDRSTSRLRQTNDCEHPERRQFIGQMRELMRHEKELISLNYQMEVLERGMLDGAPNKREETQRTYAKIRRNIERKEADIRQLKTFIDKATSSTLK